MSVSNLCGPLPDIGILDTINLLVSAILYGAQLAVQSLCMIILRRPAEDNTSAKARTLLLVTNVLIMVSSMVFMAFSAALPILDGLIISNRRNCSSRIDIEGPYNIALITTLMLNLLIGDLVVFWRAWMLWKHKRSMVAVPAVLLVCTAATVISTFASPILKKTSAGVEFVSSNTVLHYVTFGFSAVTNLTTTASISYYAWLHQKAVRGYFDVGARQERDLVLIQKISIIYTAFLILGGIAVYMSSSFRNKSFAWSLANAILPPIGMSVVSVYPSLLIVAIFLRKSMRDSTGSTQDGRRV